MDIKCYLAMTAAEYAGATVFPKNTAWMACHFSSYGTGISNLPQSLPPGSMLILNDRVPPHKHDPKKITEQLNWITEENQCAYVLLDFQQKYNNETQDLALWLSENLSIPTGISEAYAANLDSAVFLNAPPLRTPLSESLSRWTGRKLWLEAATDTETFHITERDTVIRPSNTDYISDCYRNDILHCSYAVETGSNETTIALRRDLDDLSGLLEEAAKSGVELFIGLYQQLAGFTALFN